MPRPVYCSIGPHRSEGLGRPVHSNDIAGQGSFGPRDAVVARYASSERVTSERRCLIIVNDTRFFVCHCLPLVRAAQGAGLAVHLAALDNGDLEAVRALDATYHPLTVDRTGVNLVHDARLFLQILRVMRLVRPDLVQTVSIKPIIYGGIAARCLRVSAMVSTVTGLGFTFQAEGAHWLLLRTGVEWLCRLALAHRRSRVVFQNPDDQAQFVATRLARPAQTVLIRGFGADPMVFRPAPEPAGPPVVVLPARLLWDKGIAEFVEAARLVRGAGITARFALVGDLVPHHRGGVPQATIEAWVAEGAVEWWGYRTEMADVYAASHIVCLPSYYREGIPKSLIEAATCARPIVTTDAPGCREIVHHCETGLLVPPRSATALADALGQLLRAPEQRVRMGQRGRELAICEFALERVIAETLTVYRDLLDDCG